MPIHTWFIKGYLPASSSHSNPRPPPHHTPLILILYHHLVFCFPLYINCLLQFRKSLSNRLPTYFPFYELSTQCTDSYLVSQKLGAVPLINSTFISKRNVYCKGNYFCTTLRKSHIRELGTVLLWLRFPCTENGVCLRNINIWVIFGGETWQKETAWKT